MRLGERLIENRMISETKLQRILDTQHQSGARLGDLLVSDGAVGYYDLYRTLAACCELPFADLLKDPPGRNLPIAADTADYLRLRLIPWRESGGEIFIAVCDVSEPTLAWIEERYGSGVRLVMTSPLDIRRTVETLFGNSLEEASCLSLWKTLPHASARNRLSWRQKQTIALIGTIAMICTVHQPLIIALMVMIFCHVTYSLTMIFKCLIFAASTRESPTPDWQQRLSILSDQALPVYTILVPMYKEAASLPGMLAALGNLDYPAHKLDVKLILESDDSETLNAAYALKPSAQFEIIRVPPGMLRTKPKACNYALRFARGEFVTVFDADDQPEKLQLKKAVYMFRNSPPDVVCLQARLNYYNADHNWLTRFFSLEYTVLFNFLLRGLERLQIPIPLGGTSNHVSLARLMEEGEWDPFNVTEDADLGTRFAARGYRTVMLDSVTLEEAPIAVGPWIRQRSRWIKGYMQTWLVHMRHPVKLQKTLGWKGFLGFQFFVGLSTFSFLTAPLFWLMSIAWVGEATHLDSLAFPLWLKLLMTVNILLNVLTQWYCTLSCLKLYRHTGARFAIAALLYPFYMLLHSIASYKALWQLLVKPHFWEKTTHGLAQSFALQTAEAA